LSKLILDYTTLPNALEECCIYCDLSDPLTGPSTIASRDPLISSHPNPKANTGPNAILLRDPRLDTPLDAVHRRMALKRRDRAHAKLLGTTPRNEQPCCVVCPYHIEESERLNEAFRMQKAGVGADNAPLPRRAANEMNKVFLEVFAQVEGDRRRKHEPLPCCPACPSQFLAAHAFPMGPFAKTRTIPNMGPKIPPV
jgi:hypothetical protein